MTIDSMRSGTPPGTSAIIWAKALRAEGRHDEADAVVLAHEEELARKEQDLALREHKKTRGDALRETTQIDPEHDHEVVKAIERRKVRMLPNLAALAGIVDAAPYAAVAVQFAHLDGGPAPKGTVAPPYRLFERQIEAAPNIVSAAQAIEAKFDARMLKIHAWEARVWNRYTWDTLVARLGIENASELKSSIKWIPVRRYEHFDAIADDLAGSTDDANDSESKDGDDVAATDAEASSVAVAPEGYDDDAVASTRAIAMPSAHGAAADDSDDTVDSKGANLNGSYADDAVAASAEASTTTAAPESSDDDAAAEPADAVASTDDEAEPNADDAPDSGDAANHDDANIAESEVSL